MHNISVSVLSLRVKSNNKARTYAYSSSGMAGLIIATDIFICVVFLQIRLVSKLHPLTQ